MDRAILAARIKEERERCNLTQDTLAHAMGWKSHTTIVSIENAEREIKAWELLKIASILNLSPDELLEHSPASKQPCVLWRKLPAETPDIIRKEKRIIQLCQDYRFVETLVDTSSQRTKELPKKKCLLHSASVEWANQLAEEIGKDFQLGYYPAELLEKCLEEDFGVLIIPQRLEQGSAACSRTEFGSVIVINEKEVPWRQVFSLAHELFHLITWDTELIESVLNDNPMFIKNEKLAEAFAAALLMPYSMVNLDLRGEQLTYSRVVALARKYRVSTNALMWRLCYLRFITREAVEKTLKDREFLELDKASFKEAHQSTRMLGGRFLRLAYLAYEYSLLSKSRLARMLGVKLRDVDSYMIEKGFFVTNDKPIQTTFA
jgi:Zn-dependent peptidase ImmA (M78 family)/transcriptional regulator with XRE-family HTH domain